tara:strand:+ start:306 stop:518 length:213 start_codon:yes stop_codon:yes gene_type:complete
MNTYRVSVRRPDEDKPREFESDALKAGKAIQRVLDCVGDHEVTEIGCTLFATNVELMPEQLRVRGLYFAC